MKVPVLTYNLLVFSVSIIGLALAFSNATQSVPVSALTKPTVSVTVKNRTEVLFLSIKNNLNRSLDIELKARAFVWKLASILIPNLLVQGGNLKRITLSCRFYSRNDACRRLAVTLVSTS